MIIIIGTAGKDARVSEVNGRWAVNFSIAEDRGYKEQKTGQKISSVEWYDCTRWFEKGESARKLAASITKGTSVQVVGTPTASSYQGNDGMVNQTKVKVSDLRFAGGVPKNQRKRKMVEWCKDLSLEELAKMETFIQGLIQEKAVVDKDELIEDDLPF